MSKGKVNFAFKTVEPNFEMEMGEPHQSVIFCFTVEKTTLNRIKYWLFCKFFPFRIVKWKRRRS